MPVLLRDRVGLMSRAETRMRNVDGVLDAQAGGYTSATDGDAQGIRRAEIEQGVPTK